MSKFEFIPELVVGRDYDPSPGQKFMDNFDAIFEAIKPLLPTPAKITFDWQLAIA